MLLDYLSTQSGTAKFVTLDMIAFMDTRANPLRDFPCPVESELKFFGDFLAPADTGNGAALTASVPAETGAGVAATIPSYLDQALGQKIDAVIQNDHLAQPVLDSKMNTDISTVARLTAQIFEEFGVSILDDFSAPEETGKGIVTGWGIPAEYHGALHVDMFVPTETSAAARADISIYADTGEVVILTAAAQIDYGRKLLADVSAPFATGAGVVADSPTPFSLIGIVTLDAIANLDTLVKLTVDSIMQLDYEVRFVVDFLHDTLIEYGTGIVTDFNSPVEYLTINYGDNPDRTVGRAIVVRSL